MGTLRKASGQRWQQSIHHYMLWISMVNVILDLLCRSIQARMPANPVRHQPEWQTTNSTSNKWLNCFQELLKQCIHAEICHSKLWRKATRMIITGVPQRPMLCSCKVVLACASHKRCHNCGAQESHVDNAWSSTIACQIGWVRIYSSLHQSWDMKNDNNACSKHAGKTTWIY